MSFRKLETKTLEFAYCEYLTINQQTFNNLLYSKEKRAILIFGFFLKFWYKTLEKTLKREIIQRSRES